MSKVDKLTKKSLLSQINYLCLNVPVPREGILKYIGSQPQSGTLKNKTLPFFFDLTQCSYATCCWRRSPSITVHRPCARLLIRAQNLHQRASLLWACETGCTHAWGNVRAAGQGRAQKTRRAIHPPSHQRRPAHQRRAVLIERL